MMNLAPIEFSVSILLCILVAEIGIHLNKKWQERLNRKIKEELGTLPNEKGD